METGKVGYRNWKGRVWKLDRQGIETGKVGYRNWKGRV